MYQTGYLGVKPLSAHLPYAGGFCRWWYTPWENVEGWDVINPATQMLASPLAVGEPWFGPIKVPNGDLAFTETGKRDKVGITWEQKITGMYPGDEIASRINLENMAAHEWVVVGKMRAGGMYLVIGSEARGADWTESFQSKGSEVATSTFGFSFTALSKALMLPSFDETLVTPPPGYTLPVTPTPPTEGDMEIITYNNEPQLTIPWTTARQIRFGTLPVIQVWYTDPDTGLQINPTPIISLDAAPPLMRMITVKLNAPGPGFITISL